jgi:hypothetical protein
MNTLGNANLDAPQKVLNSNATSHEISPCKITSSTLLYLTLHKELIHPALWRPVQEETAFRKLTRSHIITSAIPQCQHPSLQDRHMQMSTRESMTARICSTARSQDSDNTINTRRASIKQINSSTSLLPNLTSSQTRKSRTTS